ALGCDDPEQLLHREREGMFLAHRGDVIEPVEIRHVLNVRAVLHQLLGAAMEEPDMRIGALDNLAVHLEDQPEHAMRRRMLRSDIDGVVVDLDDAPALGFRRWGYRRAAHGSALARLGRTRGWRRCAARGMHLFVAW